MRATESLILVFFTFISRLIHQSWDILLSYYNKSPILVCFRGDRWFLVWVPSSGDWGGRAGAGACAVRPAHTWVQLGLRRKQSFRLFAAEGEDCWRRETPRKKKRHRLRGANRSRRRVVARFFHTGGYQELVNFCGPGGSRAQQRHTAGVSYQLPAWPGTTITSSSCSSSVTAVRRRRGWRTGSGPCRVFCSFLTLREEVQQYCIVCVCCACLLRTASRFININNEWNVNLRHVLVPVTGRRGPDQACRAGYRLHTFSFSLLHFSTYF